MAELADALDLGSSVTDVGVQVPSSAPRRSKLRCNQNDHLKSGHFSYASLLLLLRKKSRSARLLGCKRPHNNSLSLPTFCDFYSTVKLYRSYTTLELVGFVPASFLLCLITRLSNHTSPTARILWKGLSATKQFTGLFCLRLVFIRTTLSEQVLLVPIFVIQQIKGGFAKAPFIFTDCYIFCYINRIGL